MSITVKIKTTYNPNDVHEVTVPNEAKVEEIMKEIEKYSKVPPSAQKLIFKGKILKPEDSISTYKIETGNTLIMVKSNSFQQQEAQANNNQSSNEQTAKNQTQTSSNSGSHIIPLGEKEEDNLKIKVKTSLDDKIHEITINKNLTVLGLKEEIEKLIKVSPGSQKLVIKGKILFNDRTLSSYNATNDTVVVACCSNRGQAQESAQGNPFAGLGGFPNLGLGGLGGMGGANPEMMRQAMGNPQMMRQALALLRNPAMRNILLNQPNIRQLMETNPQARELLNNPAMLEQAMSLMSGGGRGGLNTGPSSFQNPFANLGNLRQPVQQSGQNLGDIFSTWMQNQSSGNSGSNANSGNSGSGFAPQQQPQIPNMFEQMPQANPNVDYKTLYKDQIAQIKEMGITDEDKIIEALKKCDGNVQYALNRLFS